VALYFANRQMVSRLEAPALWSGTAVLLAYLAVAWSLDGRTLRRALLR